MAATEINYRTVAAGVAIDELIAEKVFGYHLDYEFTGHEGRPAVREFCEGDDFGWLLSYSREIGDAWALVDWARKMGYMVELKEMPEGVPWLANMVNEPEIAVDLKSYVALRRVVLPDTGLVSKRRYPTVERPVWAVADETPLALCRAALLLTLELLHAARS